MISIRAQYTLQLNCVQIAPRRVRTPAAGRQPLEDGGASPPNLSYLLQQPADSAKKGGEVAVKGLPADKHIT